MKTLRILWAALRKFDGDNGLFLAAGIAFNILLSLIPLMLILLSVLGTYLYSDAEVVEHITRYFRSLVPTLDPKIMKNILGIIQHRRIAGVIGFAGLAWTAAMVFGSLRICLNIVFGVARGRGTLRGMAVDLLMVVVAGSALLASMLLTSGVGVLRRYGPGLPLDIGPLLGLVLQYLLPFLFTGLMAFLTYKIVPDRRTPTRPAFQAALFTGLLWEAAKQFFSWFVLHLGTFSLVYGSLSTVAVFFLWIYYSAIIFLLGGEVAYCLEMSGGGPPRRDRP